MKGNVIVHYEIGKGKEHNGLKDLKQDFFLFHGRDCAAQRLSSA